MAMAEKHEERPSDSGHESANSPTQHNNGNEKRSSEPKSSKGFMGKMSQMVALPEFKVGGKHLEGDLLNWLIGVIASMGFLWVTVLPSYLDTFLLTNFPACLATTRVS